MPQKLIQPINNLILSCSYKNKNYPSIIVNGKPIGVDHYGIDCMGDSQIWCQGWGIVLSTGVDSCYGNYASIMYFDCLHKDGTWCNMIANYYHLANCTLNIGAFVTKDMPIGKMGKTGTYATGVHLHLELRKYRAGETKLISPFNTSKFIGDKAALWVNPLHYMYTKTSKPDYQRYSTVRDNYINGDDYVINTI